ncbi:hypothetical protein [Microvirga aerophila]|uniref:Uncharacterized protein n=1 Tax=Microvirga aerophila TaxID=670291 RepID=A0A512C3P5_9HYPH|nr:hypothetical protein [Microvirga aerophila]GEO18836.1 hypothetical protein MAE02_65320 [Microvirga aerophila]
MSLGIGIDVRTALIRKLNVSELEELARVSGNALDNEDDDSTGDAA